jgi:Pvc16 N-terminal domain
VRTINGVSDFTVIRAVSLTLRAVLSVAITDSTDPQLGGIQVDLRSPRELRDANVDTAVSLWLHRIARIPDLVNTPEPPPGPHQRARRGVPIELGYLVTPVHAQAETRHVLIGRAIQALNDASRIRGDALQDTLAGSLEELRVHMNSDMVPELPTFFDALNMPFLICMPYVVQYVVIDSELSPIHAPVVVRREASAAALGQVAR